MDHNWGYVALGYVGTAVVLGGYCGRLLVRSRKAKHSEESQS